MEMKGVASFFHMYSKVRYMNPAGRKETKETVDKAVEKNLRKNGQNSCCDVAWFLEKKFFGFV